jgi:hypothetical protein
MASMGPLTHSRADQPSEEEAIRDFVIAHPPNEFDREAMARALQDWGAHRGPLPDLIAIQNGLNQTVAPPLTEEELQTVREALWKRLANNINTDIERGWDTNHMWETTIFQQMAFTHLLNGGSLRAGDFVALHGSLLSALQPNTYALAKKWQGFMRCVGISAKKDPACVSPGS